MGRLRRMPNDDDFHMQYSLVDGTRPFTSTVGGIDPIAESDLATKNYIDMAVGVEIDYFFNDTVSDIGGIYYDMTNTTLGGGQSTLSVAGLGTGDAQPLVNFATLLGEPGILAMRAGNYDLHLHVEKTAGTKPLIVYAEIYSRTSGGAETLRMTTHVSDEITSEVEVSLHANLAADITIPATDRIVVKLFANVGATGSAVDVALYQEGDTSSHFTFPTTSDLLSLIFLRQDGTKSLQGDMPVDSGITIDGRDISVDGDKLDTIEPGADITDADNVFLAGATMQAFTSLAGAGYFLDDDTMAANSATKVASQQSIKAYVDGHTPIAHTHDGDTLQLDGINSDGGGVFNFFTGGFGVLFDTFVEGITRLEVDNLQLDGNTLSSTDANGDINISPDGTGVAKFGNVGDTSIGDATLRFFGPQSDLKIDLGDVDHRFNETHTKYLVLAILTDATRGAAGTKGRVIFNDDDGQLNIDDGTDWTLPDGTTT